MQYKAKPASEPGWPLSGFDKLFISAAVRSLAPVRSTRLLNDMLYIPVLTEDVKTQHHVDFLLREGCTEVQRCSFGHRMTLDAAGTIIAETQDKQRQQAGCIKQTGRAPLNG